MTGLRDISSILLALPLLIFGANYFLRLFALPDGDGSAGDKLLRAMRDGGLMPFIAFSHVVVAVLLLNPRTRFPGAILQLPMSVGIVSFHISMQRAGLPVGLLLLVLNLAALADLSRLGCLLR